MATSVLNNVRPEPDKVLVDIADYVVNPPVFPNEAYDTARMCLLDAMGCAMAALNAPDCVRLLGPVVAGTRVPRSASVPGTTFKLDPVTAAWSFGVMVRWLDFNDTWLAAEWGHPSDNLGGILMAADWVGGGLTTRDILAAMIKTYEIQGVLALENSFNRVGLDHVVLVKVATTAVVAQMLGCTKEEIINAVSNAWIDGQALRTYRHAPNTGSRKSWAAGDATSRGVALALLAKKGEMGYPSALTAKTWGFYDAVFRGQPFVINRTYGSYVMENIMYKVSYPAEIHAQTAVEAAIKLHPLVRDRLEEIDRIVISTQESAMRIINKEGPLYNFADRDHCIQYMTAVGLVFGNLTSEDYHDKRAADPRIDAIRAKMVCEEDPQYSKDYLDPEKRSVANAVQVFFKDGSRTDKVEVMYPIGHRQRRTEAAPLLEDKFATNLAGRFAQERIEKILKDFRKKEKLDRTPVHKLINYFKV